MVEVDQVGRLHVCMHIKRFSAPFVAQSMHTFIVLSGELIMDLLGLKVRGLEGFTEVVEQARSEDG
jgi:hypothetical protein